jgi:hypothetical protein
MWKICKKKKKKLLLHEGKNIIKGATQVNEHFFKFFFCMFEKSQEKHNSLDYHKSFWNIFHLIAKVIAQSLTQIKMFLHI